MSFFTDHRYPFILVDRVLEKEPGKRVVAIKNVSFNERIFLGHFPKQPIFPAVYIVESLCQCAQIMLEADVAVTAKLDSFKFTRPVVPGDQLHLEVTLDKRVGDFQIANARASVEGKKVATGVIVGCKLTG
ncbi:MAG: 3-hydroxyacyl-ACP dehydratase FabZ [Deltaproteobacteria bacterium]|nr:3-hydroxyacyl-ACP dehydratase FabZ [Deltaproteobacteria bacterium]